MLKPSRRLPRAFQRPSSPFSRTLAQTLYWPRRTQRSSRRLSRLRRRSRRWQGVIRKCRTYLRVWSLSLIVALFLGVLLLFFLSPLFRITSMRVSREDPRLDIEEVQRLFLPFFGKHLMLLSPHLLEQTILMAYPEVVSVKVAKRFPSELHVTLYTDPIVANVQLGSPDSTERSFTPLGGSGTYHYLTARGVYLEYSTPIEPKEGEEERMQLNVVDWAVKPTHRQKLLEERAIQDMQHVRRLLSQSFGHTVRSIMIYARAREFHVVVAHPGLPDSRQAGSPARQQSGGDELTLWFDQARPIVQQLDRYREFLRALPLERVEEYLDLRLHDRVVYR